MNDQALRPLPNGFRIRVRVTPGAARDGLAGSGTDGAGRAFLKARVRAAPDKGAANTAVIKLLAKAFGVAKTQVRLERGGTDRTKIFQVQGGDEAVAAARAALTGAKP